MTNKSKSERAKKPLSHAQLWDDSALVDSWNEALEEYKKYHSLAARGEKVEEVLDEIEAAEAGQGPRTDVPTLEAIDNVIGDAAMDLSDGNNEDEYEPSVGSPQATAGVEELKDQMNEATRVVQSQVPQSATAIPSNLAASTSMPQALLANGREHEEPDDVLVLRRLLHWAARGAAKGVRQYARARLSLRGLMEVLRFDAERRQPTHLLDSKHAWNVDIAASPAHYIPEHASPTI